jgi:sporulation protein YlmC with PRC-barrel domain
MTSRVIAVASFISMLAVGGVLTALAQQADRPLSNPTRTNRDSTAVRDAASNRVANSQTGLSKLDGKTSVSTVRASKLIGANLKNSSDESVGEIKDLVIDAASGKIRYAAVTYGGFLGLGSKLFAVPFEAFRVRQNTSALTPGDYTLTLDVTKEQLQGAQGFDNDHWPNFADTNFTQELDRRYKVDRGHMRQ